MRGRVLIVDDNASGGTALADGLRAEGFHTSLVAGPDAAFARIETEDFDVVVAAYEVGDLSTEQFCERLHEAYPGIPVVVSAVATVEKAIEAIRAGVYDFLPSPLELDVAVVSLDRAVQHRLLKEEVRRLRRAADQRHRFEEILGESQTMMELYRLIQRTAETDASVLVVGETGTGKELVARALHQRSRRRDGPFVAVNCAAVQDSLLESELFGHAKGAFTDAKQARVGMFVRAGGGTLFLDEIGEMTPAIQPKLLRAVQERVVRPVGSDNEVPVDVRIITATNRDLDLEVENGAFRRDLYYRLNVIALHVPPLRVRGNDIILLAHHFIQHSAKRSGLEVNGVSSQAAERLLAYSWPGNVRELQNAMERAVALTEHNRITVEDLPLRIQEAKSQPRAVFTGNDAAELMTMDEVEARYIKRVLDMMGGNKSLAARALGFDRTTLYRKLKRYGLD